MKSLYNRRGIRRGDGERSQFAFFLTGAVVVLAVVFVIGIQVGRVIEKNAVKREVASGKTGGPIVLGKETPGEIGREIGSFSKEAERLGSPPAPSPEERVRETERSVTFQETLNQKKVEPPKPLQLPSEKPPPPEKHPVAAPQAAESRLYVQVGSFREQKGAETLKRRLERSGYRSRIVPFTSKTSVTIHRVLAGPYPGKSEAETDLKKIAGKFRTRPFLVRE